MLNILQKKFLLSKEGSKNMLKGIICCALLNIAFMMPMSVVFNFIRESLNIYMYHTQTNYTTILYVVMAIITFLAIYFANNLQYDSVYTTTYTETANKRISLSNHIRKLPLSFFDKRDLADLTATIMGDMEAIEHAYSHAVPEFYGTIISVTLIAVSIATMNLKMAVCLILPFPISIFMIHLAKNKKMQSEKAHYNEKLKVTEFVQETLENILPIKAYQRKEKTMSEFKKLLDSEEKEHLRAEIYNPLLLAPLKTLMRIGVPLAILVGFGEYTNGNLELASYICLIIACVVIYAPMDGCLSFIIEFMYIDTPAKRMDEIFNMKLMSGDDKQIDNFDITLENVSFGYNDTEVIKNVSFTAKQGQTTALVGASGSGKSTLAKLMLRFWDINSGTIKLGGSDIRQIEPENLLKHYSMVFQDVVLFNNTIMENIRIGRKNATDEEVIQVAKIAMVDEFVQELPQKYDTKIGENGVLLSGGERQRISIARAILKDAPIIFLDESTSSVDADNETKLQEALSNLVKNKTVIVIAHRLRTVENADKIIVLRDGKLIEEGTSKQLIDKKGEFYKLWKLQKNN
ncbi:MAG: ABC transporter ATP-binding protein [Peptoanaerobacter stomatis]|uniref:ABC transporter ATP-binding protein n=1 Tax=Peptoanaerobacter stomatis TaxID=796937 RepID=UPI003FA07607